MDYIKIPEELKKVNKIFSDNGFKAYLVGGAVRDSLLGKEIHDWDLATDAEPEDVMRIFRKVIPTGIAHGTVTILIFGKQIETTTFRTEADYSDGRHPDKVSYAKTIEEDLSRRDFTMNAIAADLTDGKIVDPFNGRNDLKNRIIRTVGDPEKRFSEDGLRPIRAVRFSGRLGFKIEDKTYEAMCRPEILKKASGISIERFRDEFSKMLLTAKPSVCFRILEETGLTQIFLPELLECRNCLQQDERGFHEFDVADHLYYACDGADFKGTEEDLLILRTAALFHDIAKPDAKSFETIDGQQLIHFYSHDKLGMVKAEKILTRLKFPNAFIEKTCHLIKEHMFFYEPSWSNAAVRRFIVRVGLENTELLFALRLADIYGMHNTPVEATGITVRNLNELRDRIKECTSAEASPVLNLKNLAVNGNDLMNAGIPKGKQLGMILNELFETVLDSPEMNEKEKLLSLAKNIYEMKYLV